MSTDAMHDRTGLDQKGATRESTRGIVGCLELCVSGNVPVHVLHVSCGIYPVIPCMLNKCELGR